MGEDIRSEMQPGPLAATVIELTLAFALLHGLRRFFGWALRDYDRSQIKNFFAPSAVCAVLILLGSGPNSSTQTMVKAIHNPNTATGVELVMAAPPVNVHPGQMIVRIQAAALNPVDFKVLQLPAALPVVRWLVDPGIGSDFAGLVVKTGRGCQWREGQHVFGMAHHVMQQLVLMSCDGGVALRPDNMPVEAAAGCGVACVTSYEALVTRRDLRPGQRLMVIGAPGACGGIAV